MRISVAIAALLGGCLGMGQVCAYASDTKGPDEQSIAALVSRAEQAQPLRRACACEADLIAQQGEQLRGRG